MARPNALMLAVALALCGCAAGPVRMQPLKAAKVGCSLPFSTDPLALNSIS